MNSSSYLYRNRVDKKYNENRVIIDGTWRKEIQRLGLLDLTNANESNNYGKMLQIIKIIWLIGLWEVEPYLGK